MEHELTLSTELSALGSVARHPIWHRHGSDHAVRQHQVSRYFDTAGFDLWRHGFSLRIEHLKRRPVQILEHRGRELAGLRSFDAWQTPATAGRPDIHALLELVLQEATLTGPLAKLLQERPLIPVFTVHRRQTSRLLQLKTGALIGAQLVRREFQCGERQVSDAAVILRPLSGDVSALFSFAQELLEVVPLRIGDRSPAEHGYALCAPASTRVTKARRIRLDPAMSVSGALYAIIGNCLEQVRGNEVGAVSSSDPEYIHQMRVGLRRLNSALGLFGKLLPYPQLLRDELTGIRRTLGAARDWEVLAHDTIGPLIQQGLGQEEAQLLSLQQLISRRATKHRKQAAVAVQSQRYAHGLLSLGRWALGVSEMVPEENWPPDVNTFARQVMRRRDGQLRRRGKRLHDVDDEARHHVRLAAKKVRYAAEFFRALYPAAKWRDYVDGLAKMQDVLGSMNDAVVADDLLRQKMFDERRLIRGAGFVRGYLAARNRHDAKRLNRLWKKFSRLPSLAENK